MGLGPDGETPPRSWCDHHTTGFIDEGSESAYRGGLGEGHAVFIFSDGRKYTGGWKDNEQEGYGVMQFPDWDGEVAYEGEWQNGKMHGKGKYTWGCGSVYEGEWNQGQEHGKGKYTLSSGNVYEGDFVEGRWEGRGKYTIVQRNALLIEYDGEWKCNRRMGYGKCTYSNGDIEMSKYEDVDQGHARPVRVGKGVRWVGQGPAAFSGPGSQCQLTMLVSAVEAGIEVDESTHFQLIKGVSEGMIMSTVGGTAKGWDNHTVLKLQESASRLEDVRYYVNRRKQAMLLADGKAVKEITMEEAKAIAGSLLTGEHGAPL